MLKRFTCLILSLVLLAGLIPAAAVTASAASNATSSSAITILKKLHPFKEDCYVRGEIGYIGYGTKCTETGKHGDQGADTHTIRETEADKTLREALKDIDTAINSFASSKGISLSQQQHDALAVFSAENGTAWTKGADDLQNAVVKGTTGRDFVKVMTGWKSGGSDEENSREDDRRKVEANMYLFGAYNSSASALETNLKEAEKSDSSSPDDLVTEYRVKVTVTNSFINVREKASIYAAKVGTVYKGDVLRITATKNANGYLWGRYVDASYEKVGYVALMYTNYDDLIAADKAEKDQADANAAKVIGTATVDVNGYVHVRSGAGTKNPIVSSLRDGVTVDLYDVQYVNGQPWGKTNVGWFSLAYAPGYTANRENTNDFNYLNYKFYDAATGKEITISEDEKTIKPATFTTITSVTVRDSAGLDGNRVNTLSKGTEFEVTKVKSDNNTIWGYTETDNDKYNGWVDLSTQYVTRNGVELEKDTSSSEKCTVGTVVNCVEVNMRNMANIGGSKVGTLPAGTVVRVKEGPKNGTKKTGWYRVDVSTSDGSKAWIRGDYLDVREGTVGEITYGKTSSSSSGGSQSGVGKGMVANTYGGVNVRTAPGTANAKVTKLLPGTVVEILSTTMHGSTKWGRIEQGWLCMDYIAMMDGDDIGGTDSSSSNAVVSTKAMYEGKAAAEDEDGVVVYKKADSSSAKVRELANGDTVTVHELLTVSEVTYDDGTTTETTKSHWARVNDGYVKDPEKNISLNSLYEETYTVTETDMLKVRVGAGTDQAREDMDLKKGDQVKITELKIVDDQIWGMFENDDLGGDNEGWICLNYCTKGAVSVGGNESSSEGGNSGSSTPSTTPTTMSTGNTGKGDYTGKIIGSAQVQEVNVRKEPSSNSEKITDLKKGTSITITETKLVDGRSWGYCGSGWINLLYVDLTPVGGSAIDAKVIAVDNTMVYESSETGAKVVGSYANRAVVNIYEEMNGMYRTDMGWISKGNCL